jgi:hypothetical protein
MDEQYPFLFCQRCGAKFQHFGATSYCLLLLDLENGLIYEFPFENKPKRWWQKIWRKKK